MTDLTRISVVCTAEAAIKKLKKAEIAVFDLKKNGAELLFSVKDKDAQKVFAIFDKPCYNVKVKRPSALKRIISSLTLRIGLVAGAIAFVAVACLSNAYILKIEVSGSGSYLEPEIRKIVADEGAGEFRKYSAFNASTATGRILALPQVTFCNIEKRGSVLIVDVQTDEEHYGSAQLKSLVSDRDGVVRNIVAVCGTAAVAAGDAVKKGDTLIFAHTLAGEEQIDCLAAGYAELECTGTAEFFAAEESEENLKSALSSTLIENENLISRTHKVKPTEGGVIYVIEYSYLHKISINLD